MKQPHYSLFIIHRSKNGQSLVEILIALAIGVIMVIGAAAVIIPSLRENSKAGQSQTAAALNKELLDNVRVLSSADWHNLYNLNKGSSNHYHLTTGTSPFSVVAGDETVTISTTTYTRYFYVNNVSRDANGNIVSSGGSDDPSTQNLTVICNWSLGTTSTLTLTEYLTRHNDNIFSQTDWSAGPGQNGPATSSGSAFSTSSNIDYTTTTGSIIIKGF